MNKLNNPTSFSKLITFVNGGEHLPTFHRVHHIVLMLTCGFYVIDGLFNIFVLDLFYLFNIAFMTSGLLQAVMWYFSRFKHYFKSMAVLYIVILYLIIIPANWFFNAGSQGPTLSYVYIAVIYSVVILFEIGFLNALAISIMIGLPTVLIIVEYYVPDAVSGYVYPIQRLSDLVFNNIAAIGILVTIVVIYTRTLKREVRRANDYSRQLRIVSETDSLTTLKNRAYSVNALQLAKQANKPFNVIILDIDHFKNINDTYGHDIGDVVLKKVSEILKCYSHANGALLSRYGGEEFLMVTFFDSFEQTMSLAESVRAAVGDIEYVQSEKVTISLGVAKSQENEDYRKVIKRADKALYDSKHLGRNRVSTLEA